MKSRPGNQILAAIDRKLLRDLVKLRGQVFTIALVTACGIASYVATRGTYESLVQARHAHYEQQRFADLFVHLQRAPETLLTHIRDIPGVSLAYGCILKPVKLAIEGFNEPAQGQAISLPERGEPLLNGVYLAEGRLPEPGRDEEVLLLKAFARAQDIHPGDHLPLVINGVLRKFRVTGIAMSPQYVFSVPPGELIADPERFAVLWLNRNVLADAYQMKGAFNYLSIQLQPGAFATTVIATLDALLEPYGGMGATDRDKQLSHIVVKNEIGRLRSIGRILPLIFLAVSAFLVNVVLTRLVQLQRTQIAMLKSIGYRDRDVALHYVKMVSVILVIGAILGLAFGIWLGHYTTHIYNDFFSFPHLRYQYDRNILGTALLISIGTAVIGAVAASRMVMRLPPAEAMRPEVPVRYRRALSESLFLQKLFGESARMVLRELERRPLRTFASIIGLSFSVALLVTSRFMFDSIDRFMAVQFEGVQREDMIVTFTNSVSERAERELAHLPGVLRVEGLRTIPVRMRFEHRKRDVQMLGYGDDIDLRRILNDRGTVQRLPRDGAILSSELAKILKVKMGQSVNIELLEGERRNLALTVMGAVDDLVAMFGYMRLDTLNRLIDEQSRISSAVLRIDPLRYAELRTALIRRPLVLGISRHARQIDQFKRQTTDLMRISSWIVTLFASIIVIGVVYNNARVSLSTRSRDLASLRVFGFRRAEVSVVLLGELALQVLLGLPPGLFMGKWLSIGLMSGIDTEQYRFPVVISAQTYAFAAMVTLGAAAVSALLVRTKLDRLDLIAALKTRE